MAIRFVSGKPGGGKTLYSVSVIIKELAFTERVVVTNVPLNLPVLNEYLQKKYPKISVNLFERVVVLDDDQIQSFWKYRGNEGMDDAGVLYVLDEIHIYFNAREWMKTGPECLHYISQHRKLRDDIIAITQAVGNVDKQFRSIAQDFAVIKNEYAAKFGWFKGRGRFLRSVYDFYTGDMARQVPFEKTSFQLDAAGTASCYNTSAGVGIEKQGEGDKLKPAKGIPVMAVFPAIVIVALLGGWGFHKFYNQMPAFIEPKLPVAEQLAAVKKEVATVEEPTSEEPKQTYRALLSIVKIGDSVRVRLQRNEDRFYVDSKDYQLEEVYTDKVIYAGEVFRVLGSQF